MPTISGKTAPVAKAAKVAPAIAIVTGVKDLTKRIDALKPTAADLQHEVHVLACSVLAHTAKHGNINLLNRFLDALPDMVRMNALSSWFEHFGQLTYGPIKEGDDPIWRIDRTKKALLGDAMVKPFWKFKANEGVPYQPLDMALWCEQQIKRLQKDTKETGNNHEHLIMFLKTYNPQGELHKATMPTVPAATTVPGATVVDNATAH